jgi:hypothetical protein
LEPEFDGPLVKALREKLNPKSDLLEVVNKEEEHFTKKQAADRVWATGYELAALLDYFGFDLKVKSKTTKEGDFMAFNPNADSERPVIILWNKDNIHWDFIDGNETIPALDDGNCGYNSIAMAIAKSLEKAVTLNLEVEKDLNEAEQAIFLDSETKDQASQLKPSEKEVVMPLSQKLEVKEALIISNKKPSPDKIKFVEKRQASLLTQPLDPDEQSFYEERAKHFSEEQKQQIESDYILALNLALQWAKEEAAYQPKNKPSLAANPSSYFFEPQGKGDVLNDDVLGSVVPIYGF